MVKIKFKQFYILAHVDSDVKWRSSFVIENTRFKFVIKVMNYFLIGNLNTTRPF